MGNTMSVLSAITLLSVANWSTVSAAILSDKMGKTTTTQKELKKTFDSIDIKKTDGEINKDELLAFMELMGEETSTFDPSEFIALADKNGGGTLDFKEFGAMMPLVTTFNGIDKDDDGKLSNVEFGAAFKEKDGFKTDTFLKAEFDKVDGDGSGYLDYSEFLNVKVFTDAAAKSGSSGVLVSASLSCMFIILLQLLL